jgi:hypothetical protein
MAAELPSTSPKSSLFQRAVAIAVICMPLAVAYVGAAFASATSRRETDVRLVELAVAILREQPRPQAVDIRGWAMDVLDLYSGVRLSTAARRALSDSLRLPGASTMRLQVDIQVNGSDGPVKLRDGESFVYTWTSSGAKSCQLTSPVNSGISLSGQSAPIGSTNPFYPPPGGSVTLIVTCTDDVSTATDAVTVQR